MFAGAFPECVTRLKGLIRDARADAIFTHSPDDRHLDHFSVARFVDQAARELNDEGAAVELYCWEPGSAGPIAGFRPDVFVELSEDDVGTKQRALSCYTSQFGPGAVGSFAADRARAYGGLVGAEYAEAFRRAPAPARLREGFAAQGARSRGGPWEGRSGFIRDLEGAPSSRAVIRLPARGAQAGGRPRRASSAGRKPGEEREG
jgi:LmbE family N-acetylglucosaminyl deacetylase